MSINREPPNGKVSATIQLTCGKDGNYHHFKKMMAVELQKILGDVANVMKTDKAHEIPAVSPADYTRQENHCTLKLRGSFALTVRRTG
jgi:hypothetical protein